MTPLVSVLIDTYNHERYIEHAIVSALDQDFPTDDYEILVVDDGSTDRTPEIVHKFAPRVRLLAKKNGGQASSFNAGIPETRGQFVAFLDGDDWFAPGKLKAVAKALAENSHVVAASHGYYEFRESTNEVKECLPREESVLHLTTSEDGRACFDAWPFLLMGAFTARREFLNRVLPIPEELVFCADSTITWAALALGVVILPEPLFYYRQHLDNNFAQSLDNRAKMRRRNEMLEIGYQRLEPLLVSLGAPIDAVQALLYPPWVETSRLTLGTFGGSRLKTFKTEMKSFGLEHPHPSFAYRLFKYALVGSATLLLPPRAFYKSRDWYGRNQLGRVREYFLSAR